MSEHSEIDEIKEKMQLFYSGRLSETNLFSFPKYVEFLLSQLEQAQQENVECHDEIEQLREENAYLHAKVMHLEPQNQKLIEALEYYATAKLFTPKSSETVSIMSEANQRARDILKEVSHGTNTGEVLDSKNGGIHAPVTTFSFTRWKQELVWVARNERGELIRAQDQSPQDAIKAAEDIQLKVKGDEVVDGTRSN